jgi:hypothetical protein
MALTNEVLKANEALSGLTDDQLAAVVQLSTNDEDTVIGTKVGEIHGQYDKDILEISGVAKNQNEKTYDYNKRILGDLKTSGGAATTLKTTITKHEATIADLTKKMADGKGNEVMKQKLQDTVDELATTKGQYKTDKDAWDVERTSFATKTTAFKVDSAYGQAISGLKFKADYPANVQKTLLDSAKSTILAQYKTDFIDDGAGSKTLVFRDDDGKIMRTKSNGLNPTTFAELIQTNLGEVLDAGKKAAGGGGKAPGEKDDKTIVDVDISSAKSQVQADELIVKQLMALGYTRGTEAFSEQKSKIWKENNIGKLPMK